MTETSIGPDGGGVIAGQGPAREPDITAGESDAPADIDGGGALDSAAEPRRGPSLRQQVEAVIAVIDEPVSADDLARVTKVSTAAVTAELTALRDEYVADGRGFELREVAGGWRLYSAADCADVVEQFVLDGTAARLTHAALETLAVVAYRQPVSRQAIGAIRGVSVEAVVRTLLARGLIAESGAGAAGATLYVTTPYFLSRLGMGSLDELPSLAPYLPMDLDEFEDTF